MPSPWDTGTDRSRPSWYSEVKAVSAFSTRSVVAWQRSDPRRIVQLTKQRGRLLTETAGCDTEHMELVRALGADRVIDYTAEDFTKDGQTYDVVFDAVGKSSFSR